MAVWGGLTDSCERREAKSKGEKERYKHQNAEFQRIARRDKKAFFSDQGKESIISSDFCINKLCDELSEMFTPLAKNKHLTFVYNNELNENTIIK